MAPYDTHWPTVGMAVISFATLIVLRRINPRIPNVLIAVVITTSLSWAVGFEENETVDVRRIGSKRVAELVGMFNEAIETRETLEGYRTAGRKVRGQLETGSDASLCLRCHGKHEVSRFKQEPGAGEQQFTLSGKALVLHEIAGLLDGHIGELKSSTSAYRAELRNMLFVRTENPNGFPQFYLRGEVPGGVPLRRGTWRIKVGNQFLNPAAVAMSGGGAVVATIPAGLPDIRMPKIVWDIVPKLLVAAVIVSLLGFMEAISIAKTMAARTHQKLNPNQELIGQGLGNIIGYFAEMLQQVLQRRPSAKHILIAGHTLAGVDSMAAEEFYRLSERLRRGGYSVSISGLKDDDLDVLGFTDQGNTVGLDAVFPTQAVAIEKIHADAHRGSDEAVCPLLEVVRPADATEEA